MVVATAGVLGSCFGGWFADRLTARGHRDGLLRAILIMAFCAMPFAFCTLPGIGAITMLIGIGLYAFFVLASMAVVPALLQVITPNYLRGQISGLYLTILNIATLALGPLFVALLTDYVFRDEKALAYSLTTLTCVATPLSLLFFLRSRLPLRARLCR
jgi:MFS family permease